MKKTLTLLMASLVCLSSYSYALTCPTPAQIKAGNFRGFTPIDIDNDEPVSQTMIKYFQAHVDHFTLAEFMDGTLYPSHCYYHLNDKNGWSQTYLGNKRSVRPSGTYWLQLPNGIARCTKGVPDCQFL